MNKRQKIVILGAGFGGLYACLELVKRLGREQTEITLINEREYFLFIPLVHEVATGNLRPSSITQSLRSLPGKHGFSFLQGRALSLDYDQRQVNIKLTPNDAYTREIQLEYDYLISSLGSMTNFMNDAVLIKNTIIEKFEIAASTSDPGEQERLLHFVIVGGGPTGVELAGEISDLVCHELKRTYPKLYQFVNISLIQAADRLVNQADMWFSRETSRILRHKMNVQVMLNERVTRVDQNGVWLDKQSLACGTVIWVAGVKARQIPAQARRDIVMDRRTNRIKVNEYLQIPNYPNVFVVGDQAWLCDKEKGQPYPMRAQFAVREGVIAARNIVKMIAGDRHAGPVQLQEFFWRDQGFILSLGKGGALAQAFGVKFSGPLAWWFYRTAYLFKLVGLRTKFRTAWDWTRGLISRRDISRL